MASRKILPATTRGLIQRAPKSCSDHVFGAFTPQTAYICRRYFARSRRYSYISRILYPASFFEGVTRPTGAQRCGQPRTIHAGSPHCVAQQALASCGRERVMREMQVLVSGRDAGIADSHGWTPPLVVVGHRSHETHLRSLRLVHRLG